ncbi:MAG: hypothetical protein ACOYLB_03460 [Phototrophicaceae bacterium]
MEIFPFDLMYPDILGLITPDRITMGNLQFAVGIYPRSAFINRPIEVVIVFQNIVDQEMRIQVRLQFPPEDKNGDMIVIDVERESFKLGIHPGEVRVLRIPIMPVLPTKPGKGIPIRVAVRYRLVDTKQLPRMVRLPGAAVVPNTVHISPYRLQALQEVDYQISRWNESVESVTTQFDIAPKVYPNVEPLTPVRYESLWAEAEMVNEKKLAAGTERIAYRMQGQFKSLNVYDMLLDEFESRVMKAGLPSYLAESQSVARLLWFTLWGQLDESEHVVQESYWFKTFCQLIAHSDEIRSMSAAGLLQDYLFEAVLLDAVILAFNLIQKEIGKTLGDESDILAYAQNLLLWISGHGTGSIQYLYLPLVMGGLYLLPKLLSHGENPWMTMDDNIECVRLRREEYKVAQSPELTEIFNVFDKVVKSTRRNLELRGYRR